MRMRAGFTPSVDRAVSSRGFRAARFTAGFSLIEIIVVIGVTLVLSGFAVHYSNVSRHTTVLSIERARIGQLILRAKSLTLATKRGAEGRPCGYGVWVDYNRSLHLFSYSPDSGESCKDIAKKKPEPKIPNWEEVEEYELAKEVRFVLPPPSSKLDMVMFLAPEPATLIWKDGRTGQAELETGFIRIEAAAGDMQATIFVTPRGEVSF
ncbi:MAG: hypothetical protein FJY98_01465 [Candidatus Liptonbacteria bacterium]|nr:hypothetical protein [Candidatus Liptonbacteria bacterium]